MYENIKLIATDVDGTLVKESSPAITDDQVKLLRKLCDAGIMVCVATGRQYGSVRKVFAPVERELFFIAENGAHILKGGETLAHTAMKREDVVAIMTKLRTLYPEGCHVVASTTNGCFLESKDEAFITLLRDGYRNDVTLTDDVLGEDAEFAKLAVYRKGSIREIG
ncbi:MAG: HAD family phosphatase, partial [Lachnospiraceae bacterium]|nr:HAD family phosphatase [Lachnospiraceae bacterium]